MKILAPASGLASGPSTRPVNVPASFGSSGSEPASFLGLAGAGCWGARDETLRAAGRDGAAVIAVGRASASAAIPRETSRVADAAMPPAGHAMLASHPPRQREMMSFMVGTLERCVGSGSLRSGDETARPRGAALWPRMIP